MDKEELRKSITRLFQICARTNESYRNVVRQLDDIIAKLPDNNFEVIARGTLRSDSTTWEPYFYIKEADGIGTDIIASSMKYNGKNIEIAIRVIPDKIINDNKEDFRIIK